MAVRLRASLGVEENRGLSIPSQFDEVLYPLAPSKTSVPQVPVRRPFRELDLSDKLRLQPTAFFHLTRGKCPQRAPLLRQIVERTTFRFQEAQTFENFAANVGNRKARIGLGAEMDTVAQIAQVLDARCLKTVNCYSP